MGSNASPSISYGIVVYEDGILNEDEMNEKFVEFVDEEGDLDNYWAFANGEDPIDMSFLERRDYNDKNPLPYEVLNFGCDGYDGWILHVPGTHFRGEDFSATNFTLPELDEVKLKRFEDFLKEHVGGTEKPDWILSVSYG